MANRNQQRGGQHAQDRNYGSRNPNQMGGGGQQGNHSQQSAYQGNHGQFGGNYGPDTNYQGSQQYDNYEAQGDFRSYADNSNTRFGSDTHSGAPNDTYDNYGLSRDAGYNPRETNANDQWEPENSRGPRGYGHSQSYGGPLGYMDETQRGSRNWQQHADRFQRASSQSGYNPGGYTSPSRGGYDQGGYEGNFGSGGMHHDPDYQQWRTEQIRGLDNDYKAWRDERYTNFSNEFGEWRKGRKDKQSDSGSSAGSRSSSDADSSSGGTHPGSANTASKSK